MNEPYVLRRITKTKKNILKIKKNNYLWSYLKTRTVQYNSLSQPFQTVINVHCTWQKRVKCKNRKHTHVLVAHLQR